MRRKNIKVSLIGLAVLVLILLCACNKVEAKNETTKIKKFMVDLGYCGNAMSFAEWKDEETGVHYIRCSNGGICPRYNADGTLYVD